MTTYTWPLGDKAFWPRTARWRTVPNSRIATSVLSGYTQTSAVPGSRWGLSLDMPEQSFAERRALHAFITRLEGSKHRVALADPSQPRPAGSIALTGVTVATAAAQFAESITLAGCGASANVVAGDWMVINGQRLMVVNSSTASGGGILTVEVRHSLRQAAAAGTAVTLDSPTSLFIVQGDPPPLAYDGAARAPAFTLELIEVFA